MTFHYFLLNCNGDFQVIAEWPSLSKDYLCASQRIYFSQIIGQSQIRSLHFLLDVFHTSKKETWRKVIEGSRWDTCQSFKPIPSYGAIISDDKMPQNFPHIRTWVHQKPPNDERICTLNHFEIRIQDFCRSFQWSQGSYHQSVIRRKREIEFIHDIK